MRIRQSSSDFQLLTNGKRFLATYNLKFADASGSTSLDRNQIKNIAIIGFGVLANQFSQFFLGITNLPTIEIGGFLVVVVQNLRKNLLVVSVAERSRCLAYPSFCFLFVGQVRQWTRFFLVGISYGRQIVIMFVFPTIFKFFGRAPTTFGETRVANLVVINQNLTTSGLNSFCNSCVRCLGDTLIALAMVVGTNIKDGMVFSVVPTDIFFFSFGKREESVALLAHCVSFFDLGKEPATGNDGMCLQKFEGRGCAHFGRNYAGQVIFYRKYIDSCNLVLMYHEFEGSHEYLGFMSFPMEIDADGYIV